MKSGKLVRITAVFVGFAVTMILGRAAGAAQFFVTETVAEGGVSDDNARATTSFIRSAISSSGSDHVTDTREMADFILQPRLMRVGSVYVVTVEKKRGNEIIYAAQSKVATLEDLDRASRRATLAALNEPPPVIASRSTMPPPNDTTEEGAPNAPYIVEVPEPRREPPRTMAQQRPPVIIVEPRVSEEERNRERIRDSAQQQQNRIEPYYVRREGESRARVTEWPVNRKVGYWTIGLGPFMPRGLDSENAMYNAMIGHNWDINPQVSLKLLGEGSFSSGNERSRLYNFAAGASWFFGDAADTAPYITGDIGYGYARDANEQVAEGFSWGTGVGFRFFRLTETTLDLLLRYSVITDAIAGQGNPGVIGVRLAVNF